MKDKFEIRVAVIGYVSVGKTTVINALFGAEYGEVSMKRTTAVVNSFRLVPPAKSATAKEDVSNKSDDDSVQVIETPRTPAMTLKETVADNAAHRSSNVVHEKEFDIEIEEKLHDMRDDTDLVIVDIPGLNEAGSFSKFKDYVNSFWHTFDVGVIVMDARQGVNTDEQMDLLKLVKTNCETIREIPTVIVLNKVDDPSNEEQRSLLKEASVAVEELFGVQDRLKALEELKRELYSKKNTNFKPDFLPAVVPISAMHAFLYRCGSKLTFENFCKMDEDFVENIGKESYGRQWRRHTKKRKLEMAFEAVSEEDNCKDGLAASNFETFVKVLAYCIGGKERQGSIIRKQVDIALSRMSTAQEDCDLGAELLSAHSKLTLLGLSTNHLPAAFWKAYKRLQDAALSAFETSLSPSVFDRPLRQLTSYLAATERIGTNDSEKITTTAKDLVLQYILKVYEKKTEIGKLPKDFGMILGSILLAARDPYFCMHFGKLKIELDYRYAEERIITRAIQRGRCPRCCQVTTRELGDRTDYCDACIIHWVDKGGTACPFCLYSSNDIQHGLYYGHAMQQSLRCTFGHSTTQYGFHTWRCGFQSDQQFYQRTDNVQSASLAQSFKADNGCLVPVDKTEYKKNVSIDIPDSLEDPNHFGFPFWKCCRLLEAAEAAKNKETRIAVPRQAWQG